MTTQDAEAERRYVQHATDFDGWYKAKRAAFVAGAEWERSRYEGLALAVTNAKLEFDAIWRAVQVGSGFDDTDAANEAGRIAENASRMMARALDRAAPTPEEKP